ncbi:hypothetical protein BSKO_08989 [Bryopsis sp. KO-2023]|nr:hypothetical protein BSKO_08989 [Bryopsis sp. KO-2023]
MDSKHAYTTLAVVWMLLAVWSAPAAGQSVLAEDEVLDKCERRGSAIGALASNNACRDFIQKCDPGSEMPQEVPQNLAKNDVQKIMEDIRKRGQQEQLLGVLEATCEELHRGFCRAAASQEVLFGESICADLLLLDQEAANCQNPVDLGFEWTNAVNANCG